MYIDIIFHTKQLEQTVWNGIISECETTAMSELHTKLSVIMQ